MTSERTPGHPSDLELAAWVDEPELGAASIPAHIEACSRCREKVADLESTRAAIALDPPTPSDVDFAVQRERILAAIQEAPRKGGRVIGRIGWLVPLAAAAGVAAIVLLGRTNEPTPGAGPAPEAVAAEAEAAAEEAAAIALDEQGFDEALVAADPLTPAAPVERSVAIEAEFALLTDAEQAAVLRELARTDFDL